MVSDAVPRDLVIVTQIAGKTADARERCSDGANIQRARIVQIDQPAREMHRAALHLLAPYLAPHPLDGRVVVAGDTPVVVIAVNLAVTQHRQ